MTALVRLLLGIVGTVIGGLLFILLGFLLIVGKLALIGFIIYFFVAAAGLVPPLDFIPLIPYI
jgi:hypothetical protein